MEILNIKCECGKVFRGTPSKEDTCPDCLKEIIQKSKAVSMCCPMCDTVLDYELFQGTHIYTCPECPFVALEYFNDGNIQDLAKYLNRDRDSW